MLPSPYDKRAQPFEHFDTPEELALHRVKGDIASGHVDFDQCQSVNGWYGHSVEVNHDKLIVHAVGGVEMRKVFSYPKLVEYVRQFDRQATLFA